MTFTALSIITIILSLAAVVATFVPRIPSVAAAYAALVCAHLAGAIYVDAKILIFWGVASAIVLGLRVLQPKALVMTAIGYMISPTAASVILCASAGAVLGAIAYMRTPAAPSIAIASSRFVEYLCAKGLPCVVTTSMAAIAIASLI